MHPSDWTQGGAGVEWEGGHGECSERPRVSSTTMAPPWPTYQTDHCEWDGGALLVVGYILATGGAFRAPFVVEKSGADQGCR